MPLGFKEDKISMKWLVSKIIYTTKCYLRINLMFGNLI
jgi:hypothetical protein